MADRVLLFAHRGRGVISPLLTRVYDAHRARFPSFIPLRVGLPSWRPGSFSSCSCPATEASASAGGSTCLGYRGAGKRRSRHPRLAGVARRSDAISRPPAPTSRHRWTHMPAEAR